MRQTTKTLRLNKQTLRHLNADHLGLVVSGSVYSGGYSCDCATDTQTADCPVAPETYYCQVGRRRNAESGSPRCG